VFYDTYEVVAHENQDLLDDTPARLALTFSRAIAAMLVTSVSTAASFFANYVSSLPVIKEFGIFMGLVIVVNFCIIVIYFPTLVIIADKVCFCCKSKRRKQVVVNRGSLDSPRGFDYNRSSEDLGIGGDGAGMASPAPGNGQVPVAELASGSNTIDSAPVMMTAAAAPLAAASKVNRVETEAAEKGKGTFALPETGGAGGGGKPMLSQLKAGSGKPASKGTVGNSVRLLFGLSKKDEHDGAHYDRESFHITADDGWGIVDRFFHNSWAPMIFRMRFLIFILTIGFVVGAGILSAVNLVPADKPPSFFSEKHNIGLLEMVNQE
jgi:hypothetical protein